MIAVIAEIESQKLNTKDTEEHEGAQRNASKRMKGRDRLP